MTHLGFGVVFIGGRSSGCVSFMTNDSDFIELERRGSSATLLILFFIISIPIYILATIYIFKSREYYLFGLMFLVIIGEYYAIKKMEATDYSKIRFTKSGITLTTLETFTLKEETLDLSINKVSSIEHYGFKFGFPKGKPRGITVYLNDKSSFFSLILIIIDPKIGIPNIYYHVNTNQKKLLDFLEKAPYPNFDQEYNFNFVSCLTCCLKEFGYNLK